MLSKSALVDASVWIVVLTLALLWVVRDVVVLVAFAVVLAYALLPAVQAVEGIRLPGGRKMSRKVAAALTLLILAVAASWGAAVAIPSLAAEAERFVQAAPGAATSILKTVRAQTADLNLGIDPALDSIRNNGGEWLQRIAGALSGAVGGVIGGMGRMLTFAVVPLLAFYLLADSGAVEASVLRFLPDGARPALVRLRGAVDRALRSYVRGQAIVCLVMGVAVGLGLVAIRHPAALLLGVVVGFAEVIPYVGFALAAFGILLAGWTVSPVQALLGVGLYIVVNWAIGTFVTPRVMGRYLEMHPFVVTVSVLAGAQLIGPAGALLALPAAATLQAVIAEFAPASHTVPHQPKRRLAPWGRLVNE